MVRQRNRGILAQSGFLGFFGCAMIWAILDDWSWSGSSQRNAPWNVSRLLPLTHHFGKVRKHTSWPLFGMLSRIWDSVTHIWNMCVPYLENQIARLSARLSMTNETATFPLRHVKNLVTLTSSTTSSKTRWTGSIEIDSRKTHQLTWNIFLESRRKDMTFGTLLLLYFHCLVVDFLSLSAWFVLRENHWQR